MKARNPLILGLFAVFATMGGCITTPRTLEPVSQNPHSTIPPEADIPISAEETAIIFYHGRWRLNRDKTVEHLYKKRGADFYRLSRIERQRALRNFRFDLSIEFTDVGTWIGTYSDGAQRGGGHGTFEVSGITDEGVTIRVTEDVESGENAEGFLDTMVIRRHGENEMLLRLVGREKAQSLDLVMAPEAQIQN